MLGPLEVDGDGGPVNVGAPKQRALLALVLVRAPAVVAVDDIVDELWGESPIASARANVRMYAANLRRELGSAVLAKRGRGYAVPAGSVDLDVARFRRAVDEGRALLAAGQFGPALVHLDEGLSLWRGPALADVPPGTALAAWCSALADERWSALEDRAQALLESGTVDRAAAQTREVLSADPLRERAHGLLVRALYRGGDVAGALTAVETARRELAEQLGVDPGEDLRRLHRAVLRRDPALFAPVRGTGAGETVVVPRQLPADVAAFAGRAAVLRRLDGLLPAEGRPEAVVISAIAGTAGVGKTTLAIHWAHRVAGRFPDGQLYVNLRGFDPDASSVVPAGSALRGFLEALGVPAERIPSEMTAQAGLYRSLLADKRVLVVLDNARDADQVRPLLPGAAGCLALVTSRNALTGLVAAEGAQPLTLDLLTAGEARQLLAHRLGEARVAAEPEAVAEIIHRCARLPLALAAVAARAATNPTFALAAFARELAATPGQLDAFAGHEPTDVRTVFSVSYRTLSPPAARLFRLLGLHPGPDIAVPAAASLAGVTPGAVRRPLAELTRASLLSEPVPGRYAFHDLLRAYATELAHKVDSEPDRNAATGRLLDHYVASAYAANAVINPHRFGVEAPTVSPGVQPETFVGYEPAMAWFGPEHANLLAAVDQAGRTGRYEQVWRVAWAMDSYLDRRGYWHDQITTSAAALSAARRCGNRRWEVGAHRSAGRAYGQLGRYTEAQAHFQESIDICTDLGDDLLRAATHHTRAWLYERQGDRRAALDNSWRAFELYRAADHPRQGSSLNQVGWYHATLGEYEQALACCRQALEMVRNQDDRHSEAATLDSLGYAHHHLGELDEAVACYRQAVDLFRDLADRYNEADALTHLGETYRSTGDVAAANEVWRRALDLLDDLRHPDAEALRARLNSDGNPG